MKLSRAPNLYSKARPPKTIILVTLECDSSLLCFPIRVPQFWHEYCDEFSSIWIIQISCLYYWTRIHFNNFFRVWNCCSAANRILVQNSLWLLRKFTLTFSKIQFTALYVKHLIIAVSMSKSKNPSLVPMRDNAVLRWLRSVAVWRASACGQWQYFIADIEAIKTLSKFPFSQSL